MAVEDQVQAAVERHVAAACTGHAQELENMRLQMQQSLDARAQVSLQLTPLHQFLWQHLLPGCNPSTGTDALPAALVEFDLI